VLYDLERDPDEMANLAGRAEAAAVEREMQARLDQWMRSTGDAWSLNYRYPVEDNGRLYKDRAFTTIDEYLQWLNNHPSPDGDAR
jgi:hypothetical protein